jgi:heme oxygenase
MPPPEPHEPPSHDPVAGDQHGTTASHALAGQLRASTRAAHHRIDHHPLLAPLVRADLDRTHYIHLLQAFAWIYQTLDPAFDEALQRLYPDAGYRSSERSAWLAEDLKVFSVANDKPSWQPPPIASSAELVGRLYAIEGSTLGGQVIARQLELSIGVGPQSGGRLFHGHGSATPARWQAFMEFAGRACPATDTAAACAAANRMFEELAQQLEIWFEPSRQA